MNKQVVTKDKLLFHPDFNKRFYINTDESNNKLRSILLHNGKPIYSHSTKLTETQRRNKIT